MLTGTPKQPLGYSVAESIRRARLYAERNMVHSVIISRMEMHPEFGDFGVLPPTEESLLLKVIYSGPARVWGASDSSMDVAGETQVFSSTSITTPIDVEGVPIISQHDDLIQVTSHPDPLTVDRFFTVMTVDSGGQFPIVRRHTVTGAARFAQWAYVEDE